jgi:hypothetical protein
MFHFVYMSYEQWGRAYIGVHSTEDIEDGYLGSFRDKSFKPTHREILCFCETREEAQNLEIEIQKAYSVDVNPDFANRYIHREKFIFDRRGTKRREESNQKTSNTCKERGIRPLVICDWTGRNHSEETKEKLRSRRIGRKHSQEQIEKQRKSLTGQRWWVNPDGQTVRAREAPGLEWQQARVYKA